jgi:hypothetical protein
VKCFIFSFCHLFWDTNVLFFGNDVSKKCKKTNIQDLFCWEEEGLSEMVLFFISQDPLSLQKPENRGNFDQPQATVVFL